ncbi:serine hydrolase domain-containing protein [Allorhodopirellula solitaria]|uniref:D-alanyl-D-alanine carboxypeptidase n=1 Tax=Allorhodopirellula solitaria TaxID=2527987 RepID=A0A5C5X226_9BACT|nr:serine hydrolase domain-containing protein [Allorhodopirellula solitaria]TWT56213.1 D-alanyl-D-alanine carboxypeptidase precursor [Allorhodopirellula solitaria]
MKRRRILHAGLSLAVAPPLLAAVREGRFDAGAEVLRKATASGQVESATMYLRQKDDVFSEAYGGAGTVDASFLLGSISKPISIAAVMSLFDAGEFKLDDRVVEFLPEFQGEGRERITMQQLMTHTSGLPDQLPENAKLRAAHSPLAEFVDAAIRTPLLFAPGGQYSYSSMAILLASEVAQRITDKPIAKLVDEVVCQPLQLKRTSLGIGRLHRESLMRCQVEHAAPESGAGDPSTKSWDWNSDYWRQLGAPWGTAFSSAGDVARFLNAFLHPQVTMLQPETARLMIQNHNPPNMRARGLGFDLGSGLNGPARNDVFGHTGSTGTICWADPATDTVCVVLTTLPGRAVTPHPRELVSSRVVESLSKEN